MAGNRVKALNLGRLDRLDDLFVEEFLDHEELRGIPSIRGDPVGIFRIAEHWGVFDQLAMLGQLGVLGG